MNKQYFFVLILIVMVITAIILGYLQKQPRHGKVIIGEKEIKVELADTILKRKNGLSNRDNLKGNTGMLFVFNRSGKYGFWMKDMNFPIDIIWIQNGKIIDVTPNVPPDDQKAIYFSREEVNFVLEISAGFAEENGVKIGESVDISL
ncbi:MAG: DUF192 domain-containing protein [Patescibacteria group bacterium]|nr:DUF192 domain-containing protein [Patescibacteria group bacterium]